jgi:hypothetical protein
LCGAGYEKFRFKSRYFHPFAASLTSNICCRLQIRILMLSQAAEVNPFRSAQFSAGSSVRASGPKPP